MSRLTWKPPCLHWFECRPGPDCSHGAMLVIHHSRYRLFDRFMAAAAIELVVPTTLDSVDPQQVHAVGGLRIVNPVPGPRRDP